MTRNEFIEKIESHFSPLFKKPVYFLGRKDTINTLELSIEGNHLCITINEEDNFVYIGHSFRGDYLEDALDYITSETYLDEPRHRLYQTDIYKSLTGNY